MEHLVENFYSESKKIFGKVLLALGAIGLLLTQDTLKAQVGAETEARADWHQFINRQTDPSAELLLPPPPEIFSQLNAFLETAREEFRTKHKSDPELFLKAVRQGLVYTIVGANHPANPTPKLEELQANGLEKNGLSDPSHARLEMTMIEETKQELGTDGKMKKRVIKRVAVKYAPKESGTNADDLRVIFYNVDHPINKMEEPIDIHGQGAGVYHARIGVNTKRNVLALSLEEGSIVSGAYFHATSRKKDGIAKAWKTYWRAKYDPITWRNIATGVVSASVQAIIYHYAFKWFGNSEHGPSLLPAILTWTNMFVFSTFSKTYANILRSKSLNKEIYRRTLSGLPLSVALAIVNHAPWLVLRTYLDVILIPLGDKIASTVYSFIPMTRNERGITAGKKFLWESRAVAEREFVSWGRQGVMALALANDTNPHAEFRYMGKLVVWLLAIPFGFADLWYANKMAKKIPGFRDDAERLKTWASPKRNFEAISNGAKDMCSRALMNLLPAYESLPHR